MEKVEERCLRWVFRLDRKTSLFNKREEVQREKLRESAGKRAWEFEENLKEGRESELARQY